MSLTPSNMLPIGTKAPDFNLMNTVDGNMLSFDQCAGLKGTVVMFICNHCPYVIHVNEELVKVANQYQAKGINFVAISSNDADKYTDDTPEKMNIVAKVLKYPFPYLYDKSQEVAKAYDAACTPDFYLFNGAKDLVYRGRLDASTPGNGEPLTGADLRKALDSVLMGEEGIAPQFPSMGCNIKWFAPLT